MANILDIDRAVEATEDLSEYRNLGADADRADILSRFRDAYGLSTDGRGTFEGRSGQQAVERAEEQEGYTITAGGEAEQGTREFSAIFSGTPLVEGLDGGKIKRLNSNVDTIIQKGYVTLNGNEDIERFYGICNRLSPILTEIDPTKLDLLIDNESIMRAMVESSDPSKLIPLLKNIQDPEKIAKLARSPDIMRAMVVSSDPSKLTRMLSEIDGPKLDTLIGNQNLMWKLSEFGDPNKFFDIIVGAQDPEDGSKFIEIYGSEADMKKYSSISSALQNGELGPGIASMDNLKSSLRRDPPLDKAVFKGKDSREILDQLIKLRDNKKYLRNFKGKGWLPDKIAPKGGSYFGKKFTNYLFFSVEESDNETNLLELAGKLGGDENEFSDLEKATEAIEILSKNKMSKWDKRFFLFLGLASVGGGLFEYFKPSEDKPSTEIKPPHSNSEPFPSCNNKDRKLGDLTIADWGLECATDIEAGSGKKECPSSPGPPFIDNPYKGDDCDSCVSKFFVAPNFLAKEVPVTDSSIDYESMVGNCQDITDAIDKIKHETWEDYILILVYCFLTFVGQTFLIAKLPLELGEGAYYIVSLFIFLIEILFIFPLITGSIISAYSDSTKYKEQLKTTFPNGIPDGDLTEEQIGKILKAMTFIGIEDPKNIKLFSLGILAFISFLIIFFTKPKDVRQAIKKKQGTDFNNALKMLDIAKSRPESSGETDNPIGKNGDMSGGQRGGKRNILPKNILPKTLNKFNKWLIIFLLVLAILINYFYNSNRSTMHKKNYIQEIKRKREKEKERSFKKNIQVKEENKNLSYEPSIVFGGQFI
jgi:preprotein translocase subunit SecG